MKLPSSTSVYLSIEKEIENISTKKNISVTFVKKSSRTIQA